MSEAEIQARRELVAACHTAIARTKAVMRFETNHIMQHSLTNLVGELTWCVREFTPAEDIKPKKEKGT